MGKKTSTTKEAAPAKRAAKPTTKSKRAAEPAVIAPPAKSSAPKNRKPAAPKAAPAKRAPKPAAKPAPAYSDADIALRAYYIAERRIAAGMPGDSHQDWLEAERQLAAEATTMKKPKPKAKKA